jgi:hypothetical protein
MLEYRAVGVVEKTVIRDVIHRALREPILKTDRIKLTKAKNIYTMTPTVLERFRRSGANLTCYYHVGWKGMQINVGQRIYSAVRTKTRRSPILAHLECAINKGVVLPSDLEKTISRPSS